MVDGAHSRSQRRDGWRLFGGPSHCHQVRFGRVQKFVYTQKQRRLVNLDFYILPPLSLDIGKSRLFQINQSLQRVYIKCLFYLKIKMNKLDNYKKIYKNQQFQQSVFKNTNMVHIT